MRKLFRNNGLSIVLFVMFLVSVTGQIVAGHKQYNEEVTQLGGRAVKIGEYLSTGHFMETTFENWESEFLQMGMYVILTVFLFQKGSVESKDPDREDEVDMLPDSTKKGAPWPVRKGGFYLALYKHSLSIAFAVLFLMSFMLHFKGSRDDFNEQQLLKHMPVESTVEYLANSRFWFESFQNWQSEFLSIFAMVVLSIFLREQGSPESKPVDAPHFETGE